MIKFVSASVLVILIVSLSSPLVAQRQDPMGEWVWRGHEDRIERGPGPEIGDYLGIPMNDAARFAADSWDANIVGLPENICRGHSADHSWREPASLRIWKEIDGSTQQVTDYRTHIMLLGPEETFYTDGRPHPPEYARHTWQGFSTAKWEGDILAVTTDHLKPNLLRWDGVPRSDKAVLSRHFMRHGNFLTMALVIYDPVYLTEPFILTLDYVYTPAQDITPFPCEAISEVDRPEGVVPSYMPGANAFLNEFPARYGIPPEAARGGAETMYPEYIEKMKTMKKLPRLPGKKWYGTG
jgi:hypothetical protein